MNCYFILQNALLNPLKQDDVQVDENGIVVSGGGTSLDEVSNTLSILSGQGSLKIVHWGTMVITAIFIIAVLLMILSIIFKVGQWQKTAQTTMLWSFAGMLLMRAIPIVILSFQSDTDIDQAFSTLIPALSQLTVFIGIAGIVLSLLFRFAYKLIEHPEYHRWSKNAMNVSVMMILFAIVSPFIFGIM